jgi:DeoR family fructose operon transcriptional repressor
VYAAERQQAIAALARQEGRVEVISLADTLDVTTETIRRDLIALERRGLLVRVHGGAIPVDRLGYEPAVAVRAAVLTAEKEAIAKRALEEIPDEGSVLLDAGTTTLRIAGLLPVDRELTVVTNSLPHATILATLPNVTLHFVGGRIRPRTLAAVDEAAQAFLQGVFADVAFIGTNGISVRRGLTTPDRSEAAVKRAFIAAARRTVVVADHTKFGTDCFSCFAALSDVDAIITDPGIDARLVAELEQAGPEVVIA